MTERLFFELPDKLEPFLAATAAVQEFCASLERQKREYTLTLLCTNESFSLFEPVFKNVEKAFWGHGMGRMVRGDYYALVVSFDVKNAEYIARTASERHLSQIFGLQIGCDPAQLPNLGGLCVNAPIQNDIGILDMPGKFELNEALLDEDFEPTTLVLPDENYAPGALDAVCHHRLIIGRRSGLTYLAAALTIPLVEIYPRDRNKKYLAKWQNVSYAMIYDDAPDVGKILKAVEAVWAHSVAFVA